MVEATRCAKIGCSKKGSYDYPLCYPHWKDFDRFAIFECEQCHRLDEMVGELNGDRELCPDCVNGKEVPVHVHARLGHHVHFLYILKQDIGEFYVGMTTDLEVRLQEHKEGMTRSTRGKNPKLVWFEKFYGEKESVGEDEKHLTLLCKKNPRAIRRIIANWRALTKLVDVEA